MNEPKAATTPRSVAELPDFPYATFAEFQDAQAHGRARVWTQFDFGSVWALDKEARFGYTLLCGTGLWGALVFGVLAWVWRDAWLLWGIPACLIGAWCATPVPGCVSGGGCVANLLLVGGGLAAWRVAPDFAWAGIGGWLCWALTCAGLMTGDALIRQEAVRSEETLLWLLARGTIVRVEQAPPAKVPKAAPPDETVWPPPPQTPPP